MSVVTNTGGQVCTEYTHTRESKLCLVFVWIFIFAEWTVAAAHLGVLL